MMISLSLTGASSNAPAGTINIAGGHGGYVAQEVVVPTSAQSQGELTVNGFNPANDREIFVLEVDSNGTPMTQAQLNQFTTDLQAAVTPVNATVESFFALPASVQGLFQNTYNLAVVFPTGNSNGAATTPDVLAYDFSEYTTIPNITITNIGVVPEPGSVGVLVVSGMGLMGRRRKRVSGSSRGGRIRQCEL
jgi:hypothetical protein